MMEKYKVMLEGQNFLIEMDGKVGKYGFYQTFFLEAASPADAENAAVLKVRSDPDLRTAVRNPKDDPPAMHVEELEEIQEFPRDTQLATGRAWYSEGAETETSNHTT